MYLQDERQVCENSTQVDVSTRFLSFSYRVVMLQGEPAQVRWAQGIEHAGS
jgi:hypothetical protein